MTVTEKGCFATCEEEARSRANGLKVLYDIPGKLVKVEKRDDVTGGHYWYLRWEA